eukprot:1243710-Pleurochrysis_carterae.AAC.1
MKVKSAASGHVISKLNKSSSAVGAARPQQAWTNRFFFFYSPSIAIVWTVAKDYKNNEPDMGAPTVTRNISPGPNE